MSSSTALTKRTASSALMPPPPPPKRIKRPAKVISEEAYTSALSHIIARDFFPGLMESEAQEQYLEALDSGDREWIDIAGRRVQQVMTPVVGGEQRGRRGVSMTPKRGFGDGQGNATPIGWTGTTPRSRAGDATPMQTMGGGRDTAARSEPGEQPEEPVDLNLGLTAFQARYTSEDNESFNALLDKQNEKRRSKYGWLWNRNKMPSKQQIAQAASRRLLTNGTETPSHEGGNSSHLVVRENLDRTDDDRPAMIDAARTNTNPRNGLMFLPEDFESAHPTLITRALAAQEASKAAPKAVAYASTRMESTALGNGEDEQSIPPSPSISAIDAAIRGQAHPSLRRGGAYADSTAPGESDVAGSETPRVNGFPFVDAEPTPSEIDFVEGRIHPQPAPQDKVDHDALLAQLIRSQHGANAEGDDSGDSVPSGPNPFSIAPSSRREAIHHKMVEKQSAAKRAPGGTLTTTPAPKDKSLGALLQKGRTPTPRFASSPRVGSGNGLKSGQAGGGGGGLTPAARALYDKIGKTPTKRHEGDGDNSATFGAGGKGKAEGGSGRWTPTPLRVRRAV